MQVLHVQFMYGYACVIFLVVSCAVNVVVDLSVLIIYSCRSLSLHTMWYSLMYFNLLLFQMRWTYCMMMESSLRHPYQLLEEGLVTIGLYTSLLSQTLKKCGTYTFMLALSLPPKTHTCTC